MYVVPSMLIPLFCLKMWRKRKQIVYGDSTKDTEWTHLIQVRLINIKQYQLSKKYVYCSSNSIVYKHNMCIFFVRRILFYKVIKSFSVLKEIFSKNLLRVSGFFRSSAFYANADMQMLFLKLS